MDNVLESSTFKILLNRKDNFWLYDGLNTACASLSLSLSSNFFSLHSGSWAENKRIGLVYKATHVLNRRRAHYLFAHTHYEFKKNEKGRLIQRDKKR